MTSMSGICFPAAPSDLTPELLTAALSIERSGLVVRDLEVVEAPGFFAVAFDAASGHFGIVLEDLQARGPSSRTSRWTFASARSDR